MSDNVEVSVIIVVYNIEKYIEKCLNSFVNQTFQELEIIIVNDGATDRSCEIAKSFDEKYCNMHMYTKSNGGPSSARNYGLTKATGKYVLFIDGDDFVEPDFVEKMYTQAELHQLDVTICKFYKYYEKKSNLNYPFEFDEKKVMDHKEAIRYYFTDRITGHVWNKLIRREILLKNKLIFEEGLLYEDAPFLLELLLAAERIGYVNKNLYYYVQREGAITRQVSLKHINDHFYRLSHMEKYLPVSIKNQCPNEYETFLIQNLCGNLDLVSRIEKDTRKTIHYKEHMEKINLYIQSLHMKRIFKEKNISRNVKMKLLILKGHLYPIYKYCYLNYIMDNN